MGDSAKEVNTPDSVAKSDNEKMPPPITTRSSTGNRKSGGESENKEVKEPEKETSEMKKVTPAIVRTRRLRHHFQSPSDSVMSPCSQGLVAKGQLQHPAVMKQKPKRLQPSND